MNASEYAKKLREQRYRTNSVVGRTLLNATGDIDQTSLGYQIAIDTLTYIKKQVTEQKFYEVAPADYLPIAVGDGSFSQNILTNLAVNTSGDFEEGNINQGTANDRLATSDAGVAPKTIKVINWAKSIGYTIFEIEQALQANNWDLIEAKHRARKKNWDLGVQMIAFLGSLTDSGVLGLLTQTDVNSDTTTITQTISSMSDVQFSAFVAAVIASYLTNTNQTALPNVFTIPLSDYVGLSAPVSATFPIISKLEYLRKAFAEVVPGGVKIMASAYGEPAQMNTRSINLTRYALYRMDAESLRMDIPVDYTVTNPNTVNNFQFQDAGYGQYTGVKAYRNLELLYFDF